MQNESSQRLGNLERLQPGSYGIDAVTHGVWYFVQWPASELDDSSSDGMMAPLTVRCIRLEHDH